jgi:hypothetical protein
LDHRALVTSAAGATLTLPFVGDAVAIIGERLRDGGRLRVTIDSRSQTITPYADRTRARQILYRENLRPGRHRIKLQTLGGSVTLEGLAIRNWRR